jgi:hypothetical protein
MLISAPAPRSGLQGDSVSASCLLEAQPPHAAKSPIENNSDSPTTTREKGRRMTSLSSFIVVALNYQQQQQPKLNFPKPALWNLIWERSLTFLPS